MASSKASSKKTTKASREVVDKTNGQAVVAAVAGVVVAREAASKRPKKATKAATGTPVDSLVLAPQKHMWRRLEEQLLEHNEFFDMMVDMVPQKLYISGESGDDYNPRLNRYHKGEAAEDSKQARKLNAKTAKRRKLDPETVESTIQAKARMDQQKQAAIGDDDDNDDGVEDDEPASVAVRVPKKTKALEQEQNESSLSDVVSVSVGQSRIEVLRAKLQAKIASQRSTSTTSNTTQQEQVSKRAARRVEKIRRKEEAKRKAKTTATTTTAQTTQKSYVVTPNTEGTMIQELQRIDYGRLTGLNHAGTTLDTSNYTKANKALQSLSKGKNLHKLLADAEAKRLKMQQLTASTEAADKEKAALMAWTDTFKEADGVRVKDDPTRLKKAIKRKDAVKKKSQKAWKARMEQQSNTAKNRHEIRKHNIQARKQGGSVGANLSSLKIKDSTTEKSSDNTGRRLSRAGFEGRKQDFLNSSKPSNARGGGGAPSGSGTKKS